jgi:SIR2-like domain
MIDSLVRAVRSRQAILFVGSGVSRNLGLPSWSELIERMARELDYDPDVFALHGSNLELAEYYKLRKGSLGPLRSWMDCNWHADEARVDSSRIHQAIVNLGCSLIYTTNYDRWLEIAFSRRKKPFVRVANVGDFTEIRDGNTQIVKLHGDFSDDDSLVLTESSYFERLAFESPLDIKLRSDSIGKTLFFVGYSISDVNIRYLLYKLHRLWAESDFSAARPKSFIFLTKPNPIQEEILTHRGISPIVSDNDDAEKGLGDFLEKLVREALNISA